MLSCRNIVTKSVMVESRTSKLAMRMMAGLGCLMMTTNDMLGVYWAFMTPEQMAAWKKWKMGQYDALNDAARKFNETGETIVEPKPHPMDPPVEKRCTCGASVCGHSGHSSWCDLA